MSPENEEMRAEYDIRGGVRGKYFERYRQSVHIEASPWVYPQETESRGEHARQSTIRIGAEPVYLPLRLVVGEPVQ
jgi:hypothetical protein